MSLSWKIDLSLRKNEDALVTVIVTFLIFSCLTYTYIYRGKERESVGLSWKNHVIIVMRIEYNDMHWKAFREPLHSNILLYGQTFWKTATMTYHWALMCFSWNSELHILYVSHCHDTVWSLMLKHVNMSHSPILQTLPLMFLSFP